MSEPFWQRSLDTLSYEDIATFIDESVPEGDHLEYKLPSYNEQNGKVEFGPSFLETIVSFANGAGGLIICGVREDQRTKRPAGIQGISLAREKRPRDLAVAVRDVCADAIEPMIPLEARAFAIPAGEEAAGNQLLLVCVRRGLLPPYNLLGHGIFIRNGDRDDHARVREIEALFNRRDSAMGYQENLWGRVRKRTFTHESQHLAEYPPFLMVGLTPAFPIEPIIVAEPSDDVFKQLCIAPFNTDGFVLREPEGIMFDRWAADHGVEHPPFACAYGDGSIGVRMNVAPGVRLENKEAEPWPLDLLDTWLLLRRVLALAAQWPRNACQYGGPLICWVAFGNLANTVVTVPIDRFALPLPPIRNRMPGWHTTFEWDRGSDIDDLIEYHLAPLTRLLQYPQYHTVKHHIRARVQVQQRLMGS